MGQIVLCIGSPNYHLANTSTLISPLVGKTPSFIKNSQRFGEIAKNIHLNPSENMVCFDIKSLFNNFPIDEAVKVIKEKLQEDETSSEKTALEICLRTQYFPFRGEFYQQKDGKAMGFPVSPVVANIYMEMFEQLALNTALHAPSIWKRSVDDTFCIKEAEHVDNSWIT